MTTIVVLGDVQNSEASKRSVSLSNDEWFILSQCLEAFSDTFRTKHSQVIATYVTRGQIQEAISEANHMNILLQKLDTLQAKIV